MRRTRRPVGISIAASDVIVRGFTVDDSGITAKCYNNVGDVYRVVI